MNDLINEYQKTAESLEDQKVELAEQLRIVKEEQFFKNRDANKIKRKIAVIEDELFDLRIAINMMKGRGDSNGLSK